MNFAREGLLFIAIAAIVAAGAFAFAVSLRSWGLWLAAFVLLLLALWVAYFFRDPERVGSVGSSRRGLRGFRVAGFKRLGGNDTVAAPLVASSRLGVHIRVTSLQAYVLLVRVARFLTCRRSLSLMFPATQYGN